jgi:cathepsin D
MGLAFDTIANTRATPFWQALSDGGQSSSKEMSFWLTRFQNDPNAAQEENGGVFTLGGRNTTLFSGDVDFQSIPSGQTPSFWLLSLSGECGFPLFLSSFFLVDDSLRGLCMLEVTVQGNKVQVSSGNSALSAIDTGTTLIGGPASDVRNIWEAVPDSVEIGDQMPGFWAFRELLSF